MVSKSECGKITKGCGLESHLRLGFFRVPNGFY